MMKHPITHIRVLATWDEEASVWIATSDDLPGLVTEAPTQAALVKKLCVMIPELLELEDEDPAQDIPIELVATYSLATLKQFCA